MQTLQNLEVLEIETLELLNSIRVLEFLYFGGETMLRLCHNLNRYSTDLYFWLDTSANSKQIYKSIRNAFSDNYKLTDSMNKRNILLFEFKSSSVNRSLKIEIRKEQTDFDWEYKIAFSKFTTKQVMVKALTLSQMMRNKFDALLSSKIIRDALDIKFLLMRGIELPNDKEKLQAALQIINNFKEQDFKVTLGSILDEKERNYYLKNRFKLLKEELKRHIKFIF